MIFISVMSFIIFLCPTGVCIFLRKFMGIFLPFFGYLAIFNLREPLIILCWASRVKIFRQMRQNFARVVGATRRNFVKYDEKDSADSSASEFLEVPLIIFLTSVALTRCIHKSRINNCSCMRYNTLRFQLRCELIK